MERGEAHKWLGFTWGSVLPTHILKNGNNLFLCPELNNRCSLIKPKSHKENNMSNLYPKQRASIPIHKECLQINKKKYTRGKAWSEVMNGNGNKKRYLGV